MSEQTETDPNKQWSDMAASAQKGDAAAYRALLSALVPVIRRNVVRSLPNPQNADDVVPEVLISVHKAPHTYDPKRPFLPWLYTVHHPFSQNRLSAQPLRAEREYEAIP